MHPELAKAALAFLARVDLKGGEAPALMQVVAALEADANAAPNGELHRPDLPAPVHAGRKRT